MTIYVDPLAGWPNGEWCHMATDGPLDELHRFAGRIGLRRSWFQDEARRPHYDLRPSKRAMAIAAGARPVSSQELFEKCFRKE